MTALVAAEQREFRPIAASSIPGEILSPSQVSTYLACSAKWWMKYGVGLPDPSSGGAVRGKAVHSIVAFAMQAKMEGVNLEPAGIADAFDHAWEQAAEGAEFSEHDDVDQLKRSGAVLAAKYLAEAGPGIQPAAVELPFVGAIAGVAVRGIVDLVDTSGRVIDLKTSSRKSKTIKSDHAFQLATYTALTPGASGAARIDTLVSTKKPQLIQLDHTPGEQGRKLVERLYPLAAEGMAAGLYMPNRSSTICSRRHCNFWRECMLEFGGVVE